MANIAAYTSTMGAGKRVRQVRKRASEFSYLPHETNRGSREDPAFVCPVQRDNRAEARCRWGQTTVRGSSET